MEKVLTNTQAEAGTRVRVRRAFSLRQLLGTVLFYNGQTDSVSVELDEGGLVERPPYFFEVSHD